MPERRTRTRAKDAQRSVILKPGLWKGELEVRGQPALIPREFNLREREDFEQFVEALKGTREYHHAEYKELIDLLDFAKMKIVGGVPVRYVDGFKEHENNIQPIIRVFNILFVNTKIPRSLMRPFIFREIADIKLELEGKTREEVRRIGLNRERAYVERIRLLHPYMEYLRKHYPAVYYERVSAWAYPKKK